MTSLPALDGTLFALGATGGLATTAGAVMAGLTVIAGASAWLAAREEFGLKRERGSAWTLAFIALASTALAIASAGAGAFVGARVTLAVLPAAAAFALLAIAAEIAGFPVPRFRAVPTPTLAIAAGVLLEVALWTL